MSSFDVDVDDICWYVDIDDAILSIQHYSQHIKYCLYIIVLINEHNTILYFCSHKSFFPSMQQLLSSIEQEIIHLWPDDKQLQKDNMKRVHEWFIPALNDIITTKFKSHQPKISFIGIGGSNVVIKLNNKLYRIAYHQPRQEYLSDVKYEFEILNKHDFGINAPIDYKFIPNKLWWYEIKFIPTIYQGATLKEYSKLFHKVFKLHKYGLFWFDVHEGNIMHTDDGELIIVDFDTDNVDNWMKEYMQQFKNIKLPAIKTCCDKYIHEWRDLRDLRFKIFMYLKLDITNANWMKFCFGEFMYKAKYNISNCYPTSLLNEQLKCKGNIGF